MKRFALLFLVVFTALSGYAQTTLTLEDAVLNGRKYYPQGLIMPQWVPATDAYSHLIDGYQTMAIIDAKSGEESGRITAGQINDALNRRQSRSKPKRHLDARVAGRPYGKIH